MTSTDPGTDHAVDPAVIAARRVVGLYGDPDVSWSIVLALDLGEALVVADVASAAAALVTAYPHLGAVPDIARFGPDDEVDALGALADASYGDRDPLTRIALSTDGRTLLVAAHHGAVDGLGLLGAAARLIGAELTSSARGIERSTEPTAFLRATLRRLREALMHPPVRLRSAASSGSGDWLVGRDLAVSVGSAALVSAAATAVRRWNAGQDPRGRRLMIAMGLSRRPGSPTPTPDRDTAYVRLPADVIGSVATAAAMIAATPPEPAFPVTDGGGIGPRVTRLLSARLGSTVLVSNLGRIDGGTVVGVRFWPVPTGPSGTAVGLATAGGRTSVAVRARRGWFASDEAQRIADLVAAALTEAAAPAQ